jgi:hypothetical protein
MLKDYGAAYPGADYLDGFHLDYKWEKYLNPLASQALKQTNMPDYAKRSIGVILRGGKND